MGIQVCLYETGSAWSNLANSSRENLLTFELSNHVLIKLIIQQYNYIGHECYLVFFYTK